jgi:signal transduction histidine kinase
MHKKYSPHTPPPWWPEEEPWPPQKSHNLRQWHTVRQNFLRRIGCLFGIIFIAMIILAGFIADGIMQHRMPLGMHPMPQNVPLFFRVISWLLFAGIILGLFFIASLFRKTAIPMADMLDAAGKVADGDYSARVPEKGPVEITALATAFNEMTGKLQVNEEQRRMLLADISHELRTPLTIIQGNLEGMLDGIYPADSTRLQGLLDETQTLARIIEDLRTLSVVESGSLKLQLERVNPMEFLEEFIPAYQTLAKSRQVRLDAVSQQHLPELEMDPTRIREVLSNLITNALRYTKAGGHIQISLDFVQQTPARLQFIIQDDGIGIPEQDLPHIFERFYKDRDSSGSGLGLPIAKSLVEAHGGSIRADSFPGKGTSITFTLPIKA